VRFAEDGFEAHSGTAEDGFEAHSGTAEDGFEALKVGLLRTDLRLSKRFCGELRLLECDALSLDVCGRFGGTLPLYSKIYGSRQIADHCDIMSDVATVLNRAWKCN